jgi:hypothetical protein
MREVLERFLGDIAQAKVLMDADLPFLLQLETMIVDKLRDPVRQLQEQGLIPRDGAPMAGGGGMPGMPGATPQQVPGVMQQAAAPNADELQRLLSQGQ